jgi:UDPglucose--hexose-1-phosphate uridylyltransferase
MFEGLSIFGGNKYSINWIDEWKDNYDLSSAEKINEALKIEIGKTFAKVLECAGVYKNEEDFMRFIAVL